MMPSIERDRLRERDRQARALMNSEPSPTSGGAPLFGAPVRVSPSPGDRVKQNIQSKLGEYDKVKHFVLEEPKQLLGFDGVPASPAPAPVPSQPPQSSRAHEFKKPPYHPAQQNRQPYSRTGCINKANDGKSAYGGGRGFYPGQSSSGVKHGADQRVNGVVNPPPKAPSAPMHQPHQRQMNRNHRPYMSDMPQMHKDLGRSSANSTDVEYILKEMTEVMTPLTAIAATPRKEMESKFTFPDFYAKYPEPVDSIMKTSLLSPPKPESPPPHPVSPPPATPCPQKQYKPLADLSGRHGLLQQFPSDPLVHDLILSEDSDEDTKVPEAPKIPVVEALPTRIVDLTQSPIPKMTLTSPTVSVVPEPVRPMSVSPDGSSSSSDSGSDNSESDSSTSTPAPQELPNPVLPEPPRQSWELKSFLQPPSNPERKLTPEPPPVLKPPKIDDDLELELVDDVLSKPPLLSSLSDSDAEKKGKQKPVGRPKRRKKTVKSLPVQTDSEDENVVQPTVPSPRTTRISNKTLSGSETEVKPNSKREKPFRKRQPSNSLKRNSTEISRKKSSVSTSNATPKVESESLTRRGRKRIIKAPTMTNDTDSDHEIRSEL